MSRLALYRKYRSRNLGEVVGQDHITQTLLSSIKSGNISHAYLFTGPRGVGKTSVARILAHEINGITPKDEQSHLDIIEIDAASNRGIDEIRALREKVAVASTTLKYKVYIIDEAHMLTREAFNALLKTLEEPPSHVVFILATTEAHKLPATIISRTQRYDFSAHTVEDITSHLEFISTNETIKFQKSALEIIAEQSDGGMRDAISLLDQLSSSGETLTVDFVNSRLSLLNSKTRDEILTLCNSGQVEAVMILLNQCFQDGYDAIVIATQLIQTLRAQLYYPNSKFSKEFIIKALNLLQEACFQAKNTTHVSLPLEIAITTLALMNSNNSQSSPPTAQPNPDSLHKAKHKESKITKQESKTSQTQKQIQTSPPTIAADDSTAFAKGLSIIKENNNSLYALLRSANAHLDGDKLQVDCRFKFHKDRIEEYRNHSFIEKVMTKATGRPITLKCQLSQDNVSQKVDKDSELVSSAMAILGGELVDE